MSRLQQDLIQKAYGIIGDATPLATDCGALCGAACCEGDGGMLLFPGEADILSGLSGFRLFRVPFGGRRVWWLSCEGQCDRTQRPLACRMYPLAPRIGPNGAVSAWRDLRAIAMCPLAREGRLAPGFMEAVNAAYELLADDPAILSFMEAISDEVATLDRLIRLL